MEVESQGVYLDDLKDVSESGIRAHQEQSEIMATFEKKRIMRSLAVPTDDLRVKQKLRELGEPISLFGEGPAERRDRLTEWMALIAMEGKEDAFKKDESDDESDEEEEVKEEFFTYGPDELKFARREILNDSMLRAKTRLALQREEIKFPFASRKRIRHEHYTNLQTFETKALQFGDDRPMGYCRFSPNSRLLATASWSGIVKLWNVPQSEHIFSLKGHKERASGLDFHPRATLDQSPDAVNLVSGAGDGSINLWSFTSDLPVAKLEGHEGRVARVAFHPSGRFVGSASFDTSWRLWDVATQSELLLQEGHSREAFAIEFQNDGALVATAGMDSIGRVWDLRTGRSVMVLQGHVKSVLTLDWSPNGYQLATGSDDNTIRIWDIRAAASIYTVPAHKNIVTQVRYWHAARDFENRNHAENGWTFPGRDSDAMDESIDPQDEALNSLNEIRQVSDADESERNAYLSRKGSAIRHHVLNGSFLASSSYDGTCKIWSDGDFKPLRSLSGLEGKVMCTDISPDGQYIATSLYDRTFKIYASDQETVI